MAMYLPEWEIEESIARDPNLIRIPHRLEDLELVERQRYLKKIGGYVDLLFKSHKRYVIVEVKSNRLDMRNSETLTQIGKYRNALSEEMRVRVEDIVCVLASPVGFSNEIKKLCRTKRVIPKKLDEASIVKVISANNHAASLLRSATSKYRKILERRGIATNSGQLMVGEIERRRQVFQEIKSIRTFLRRSIHDSFAKRKIAELFQQISARAPIQSHEVGSGRQGKLANSYDMWFWMFYSVMDRRANAATFVKAKEALEAQGIFLPQRIVKEIEANGERATIDKITEILKKAGFPLLHERGVGETAFPKSIVDAAKFMRRYEYDFDKLYSHHLRVSHGDLQLAVRSLWNDLRKSIYGVGPRIASQFIRGMVLKGPWKLPLNENKFLEKCRFNLRFAGKTRLALIEDEETYHEDLGEFADEYLEGNRGIISHVLWYLRKKYCDKNPDCKECELSGYCVRACALALEKANKEFFDMVENR